MRLRHALAIALLLASFIFITSCSGLAVIPAAAPTATPAPATPEPTLSPTPELTPEPTPTPTVEPTPSPTPEPTPEPTPQEMDLLFTGDIMYHGPTVERQLDKETGTYDFTSYFERIAPIIQKADFAIGNLESPVWDVKKSTLGELRFCAPPEAIPALRAAGFDVLCVANNHINDQGLPALANTIQAVEDNNMLTTGAWRNDRERDKICMLTQNGVNVALFAYTRFVNRGWRNDDGMGVNTIDPERMKTDVTSARAAGADYIIFYLHFGTEEMQDPDSYQKKIVQALKEAGADAVIGHHPHVLQPIAIDADGKFLTAYSLGNVITYRNSLARQLSALLKFTVVKDPLTGKTSIKDLSYIPTWAKAIAAEGEETPRMYAFDLRQALRDCEAGTDTLVTKKYLKDLQKGMKIVEDVLGKEYMEPLAE